MVHRSFAFAIFISASIWSCAQITSARGPKIVTPLRPLLEALDRAGLSGSLELSGHCGVGLPQDLPHMRAPTVSGGSALRLAREIFLDDPAMQVRQDPDGTIRMKENGTPTELLDVRINQVSFEKNGMPLQYAVYSPGTALYYVILKAPEVVAFAKAHDIEIRFVGTIGMNGQFPADAPHISGSMGDLTLLQALDRLLKTFPGIWVYKSCPADGKGQEVSFRFFSLQDPGTILRWAPQER